MALLIVPGVCRFTVNAVLAGIDVATILDFDINTSGLFQDRIDSIDDQAGVIVNQWSDHVLPWISNDYQAVSVSWVDMDTDDGSVGAKTTGGDEAWPQSGGEAQVSCPNNVAMLVTKRVQAGRSSRNGRMFIPGIASGQVQAADPRRLAGAYVTALQTHMDDMLTALNQDVSVPVTYQSKLVVTHVLTRDEDGHPLTGEGREVTQLTVLPLLATQKRRQRP